MANRDERDRPWWKHAVCYQIYVRSFADSDGDGIGDLAGITSRLPYLSELGVDAVWITPFYTSPQIDHGYDVADYCDVDPLFGDLAAFDELLAKAHAHDIRVIVDLVPNHTSSAHPWFRAALAAGPGSPERARYLFRAGNQPFNNWRSVFGGIAWEQVEDGEWYLHLFDASQPDLDWRNPEVPAMFEDVLHFWLDRGVDGFRIDVAHGLFKEAGLPDQRDPVSLEDADDTSMIRLRPEHEPMWDQPEVHGVYRRWREILDSYDRDRMAVAEAWTRDEASTARYTRPDELQQSFNFHWLTAPWAAAEFGAVISDTLDAVAQYGASATWVLSNHDVIRHTTRYGGGPVGLARARAALMTMLALPGSAYLYQGEELGLPEVTDLPLSALTDPMYHRSNGVRRGRDGCRVPMPWTAEADSFGFSRTASWLPQPAWFADHAVDRLRDGSSILQLYRSALSLRDLFGSSDLHWLPAEPGVLAFTRGDNFACVVNCSTRWVSTPVGGDLLCASDPSADEQKLPPNSAAWFLVAAAESVGEAA